MAITDADDFAAPGALTRLRTRLHAVLASEQFAAQRMAGTAFLIRVAGAAIVFLSQVLLARWMGSSEFGSYVYAGTWLMLVGDTIHLGLPLTAQRYIPEYTARGEFDRLRGFIVGSRRIVFATGTVTALGGAFAVHIFGHSLDSGTVLPIYFACVALPFYTLSNMLDGLARSYDAVHVALLPPFVLRPALLIAAVAGLHASGIITNAPTAMAAFAFAIWSTTLLQLVLIGRQIKRNVPAGPRRYDVRGWLKTSLPILTVWAFFLLLTYTDVLVLRQFRPPDEVAHYFAATKILSLVFFVYFSVSAAVAHRFAALHVARNREALADFAASTVRWTFWPSLAATAVILAAGKPILWLFGPDFVAAYPLLFILAASLIARAAVGPAERVLNMSGEQRICAAIYAVALAVNLAGALALAPRFGATGVATAIAIAITAESIMLFVTAKRRLGLHLLIWQPRAKQ
jgi:O-antigen/teichoic acid export membrane protein